MGEGRLSLDGKGRALAEDDWDAPPKVIEPDVTGPVAAGTDVTIPALQHRPKRPGRQPTHALPSFTQTQPLQLPARLHRQQAIHRFTSSALFASTPLIPHPLYVYVRVRTYVYTCTCVLNGITRALACVRVRPLAWVRGLLRVRECRKGRVHRANASI